VLLAGCATADLAPPADLPSALRAPSNQRLITQARAVGVQIYLCQADAQRPEQFDWVLKAPEAQLTDRSGRAIIRHSAGPTWEAQDGSAVVGEVVARDAGPDPMAIPWLLLRAKSTSGHGLLSGTQSIQRLHTIGGKAPAGGCSALLAGAEARVQYSADYLFYGVRSR